MHDIRCKKYYRCFEKKRVTEVAAILEMYPPELQQRFSLPNKVARTIFDKAYSWNLHEIVRDKSRESRRIAQEMQERAERARGVAIVQRAKAQRSSSQSIATRRECAVQGDYAHLQTFRDRTNDYMNNSRPCSRASAQPVFSRAWASDGPNTPSTTPFTTPGQTPANSRPTTSQVKKAGLEAKPHPLERRPSSVREPGERIERPYPTRPVCCPTS